MGRLSRFLLGFILVLSPLVLGSNRAIFWSFNAGIVAIALLFYALAEWKNLKRSVSDWALPMQMLYLYLLPIVWMLFQLIPGMPRFLAHPVWQAVPEVAATVSINPPQTILALLWWLPMGVAFIAMRAGTKRGGIKFFLHLLLATVTAVALFGLANLYLGWHTVGLVDSVDNGNWVTGTFINRNTAASYFTIGLAIATALALQGYQEMRNVIAGGSFIARAFLVLSSKVSIYVAGGVLLFIALLLTGSRAGLASGICAMVLVYIFTQSGVKKWNYKWPVISLVILVALAFSSTSLLERANGASSSWDRVDLAYEAINAIADRPILGHGAGAYQSVEPIFHSAALTDTKVWNRAHNTYLEAAADLGLPFTILWIAILANILRALYRFKPVSLKFLPATAALLAVAVAEGLHGLVDFSLQIQAVAIAVAALFGLAVGEVTTNENRKPLQYSK
jgi:O-antigen ligase